MLRKSEPIYGLLAEFTDVESLMAAAHKVREAGYRKTDAYAPFPVHDLAEALGSRRTYVPLFVLVGGILGAFAGFGMCCYANIVSYPLNIGGRPLYSWPAFVPITFECTILGSAYTAVFGMLALNGLPKPYNPLFNVPAFARASRDRFFISIESKDAKFDVEQTKQFLSSIGSASVEIVPP